MGCAAEIIVLNDVRARQERQAIRQQLHERFDEWLDEVEAQLPETPATLAQVSETIWSLRQALTARVAQTLIAQTHAAARDQKHLGWSTGQMHPDVQQAAADLATAMPFETASAMLERLSGIAVSSERIHPLTNQVAEGLSVLEVAPSRDAIDQRVAEVAAGRFCRARFGFGI